MKGAVDSSTAATHVRHGPNDLASWHQESSLDKGWVALEQALFKGAQGSGVVDAYMARQNRTQLGFAPIPLCRADTVAHNTAAFQ